MFQIVQTFILHYLNSEPADASESFGVFIKIHFWLSFQSVNLSPWDIAMGSSFK